MAEVFSLIVEVNDANDACLEGFRGLKHRKPLFEELLVEGFEAILMLLSSSFTCGKILVQSHMLGGTFQQTLLERAAGSGPSQVLACELSIMEEVTGITVPAKSANLAFAWASRPCPQSDLASLGLASAALLPLRFVVLDGLTDAANVGTIVRVAAAFGATAILLSTDCCDALSPRAVRVSLGHVFHIPLLQGNLVAMLDELKQAKVMTMAAIVQDAKFLDEVPILPQRWALVLGSEHYGVSAAVRAVCDLPLKVRMADGVDSLNVGT
ncbi:unnamed protein product [Durusdinium trenchii]|uniref:Uncharacterized protein n=2 Tax=Durusdinium trenchii TaxID=1381693 RepID=A0ABP0MD11_9DINO